MVDYGGAQLVHSLDFQFMAQLQQINLSNHTHPHLVSLLHQILESPVAHLSNSDLSE